MPTARDCCNTPRSWRSRRPGWSRRAAGGPTRDLGKSSNSRCNNSSRNPPTRRTRRRRSPSCIEGEEEHGRIAAMQTLNVVHLREITAELAASGKRVKVLWQQPGSLAFVARGREYRSEFHVNDSDEVTYMIKGTMRLHYRTPEGKEEVAVIPEGATNFMP